MATAKRLASLDLREAQATNAEDQRTIRELVEQMPGGFDAVNAFVRGSIRQALMAVNQSFDHEFRQLVTLLSTSQGSQDEAPGLEVAEALPRLLTGSPNMPIVQKTIQPDNTTPKNYGSSSS
ncbi:unnamed protein product [Symbiodinium necroappetens]|uniref:Uncharacterized protein n=1 Tax=Symbiodinium necroappetens TaxID=1628268 RepID=A0A812MH53_9DINO|nr:unnamed protein product [Symbiodinium necroappetens]